MVYRWVVDGVRTSQGGSVRLRRNIYPDSPLRVRRRIAMPMQPGTYGLEFTVLQVQPQGTPSTRGPKLLVPVTIE
jgi:hypothetical protein